MAPATTPAAVAATLKTILDAPLVTITPKPEDIRDLHQRGKRERAMKGFRSIGGAQRFLSAFSGISPHFRPRRHRLTAVQYRHEMSTRFTTWNEVVGLPATV